jgi:hypothetical protein
MASGKPVKIWAQKRHGLRATLLDVFYVGAFVFVMNLGFG